MNIRKILNTQTNEKSANGKLRFDTIRTSPYKFSNKRKH